MIGFVVVGIILVYIWYLYNSLQSPRLAVTEAWADIDVQLQRRSNLIPNLIETVKGYAKHEKELLEEITTLRQQSIQMQGTNSTQRGDLEASIGAKLTTLFANVEAYPDLKANQNFLDLQNQLTKTEDEIASARRIYNGNVAIYNSKISTFPTLLLAKFLHYTPATFFQTQG